jgi:hypothetical protein
LLRGNRPEQQNAPVGATHTKPGLARTESEIFMSDVKNTVSKLPLSPQGKVNKWAEQYVQMERAKLKAA